MSDARSNDAGLLRIEGAVARPARLRFADLEAMPNSDRVLNVSRLHRSRRGDGVTLDALLRLAAPGPDATRVILHADGDDFHVGLPLAALRARAVVVYRLDGKPLPAGDGGPFRLLVRDAAECHADGIDECANVKFLSRIEIG